LFNGLTPFYTCEAEVAGECGDLEEEVPVWAPTSFPGDSCGHIFLNQLNKVDRFHVNESN
jgi:hypothetical protein